MLSPVTEMEGSIVRNNDISSEILKLELNSCIILTRKARELVRKCFFQGSYSPVSTLTSSLDTKILDISENLFSEMRIREECGSKND
jgi:hypothetical protein